MSEHLESLGEQIANGVTHGIGAIASIVGLVFLVIRAAAIGETAHVVSASVFGGSLVLVYLASTLYHSLAHSKVRGGLQRFDHMAIYCLIAGTYTPFGLVSLPGAWGWVVFGVPWGVAVLGIAFKAVFGTRYHGVSTALYLGMGWMAVVAAQPLWTHVSGAGLGWLFGGGMAYSLGVVFFLWTKLRFHHAIWHLFVLAGSSCHFVAIFEHVLPK